MREAVIIGAARTPITGLGGALAPLSATELGRLVIEEALGRAGLAASQADEVIMGQVLPLGCGQNPARQAALKAGLDYDTGCLTINKVCGSGLMAVMLAAGRVRLGEAEVVVAGGMESMSNAPFFLEKARFGYRLGPGALKDHMVHDGLWDQINDFHMGVSNELVSQKYGVSRARQDEYAAQSYQRALEALASGRFAGETMAVTVPGRLVSQDECPRPTRLEDLGRMPPAFTPDGLTTAGNASVIADGAAAVVVASREKALSLGRPPLARITASATAGLDPRYVLAAPILAIPRLLEKRGIPLEAVDLIELNEAFAGSTVAVMDELGLKEERLNVNGGAVALGHPIGASGCRVLVTLLAELARRNLSVGLATLCLGGGEAVAMLVERE